jgi:murein DD-endopeptidase MepM/ murein hydrolase activator NlpD
MVVDEREIGSVEARNAYTFESGEVVVNDGGTGLTVTLTDDLNGFSAGTKVVVADVSATAGTAAPEPTATPTATPEPTATATPEPTSSPKPRNTTPRWKKRLLSKRFVFPINGPARIGGPFGSFRAIGAHEGNDLFADFGTPVLAVADGIVKNVGSLPISGNRLWVYADGGDQFFYAHLASFAPAAINDRHVEAGTILGYNGNSPLLRAGEAFPTVVGIKSVGRILPAREAVLTALTRSRPPIRWRPGSRFRCRRSVPAGPG